MRLVPPAGRYTLGYVESVLGVKRGDKLMQVGVGSGVNAGVNVWRVSGVVRIA